MSTTLLRLDDKTIINISHIVEITITNLNKLAQERGQHHQTSEQRSRMHDMYWEVSVYLRSDNTGYNPQRYVERFNTEAEAQKWVTHKFGGSIVNNI